jgi:hypothetical protein
MIIRGRRNKQDSLLGTTEMGKFLNYLTLGMDACIANESRVNYINNELLASGKDIASIGCGSCIEFWGNHGEFDDYDIFLLDQDQGAFESAKMNTLDFKNYNFHLDNVIKFILDKNTRAIMGMRDFIYTIGLLDYFNVKQSKKIIASIWEAVKPGGKLLFTNGIKTNPTRTWMEYCGDWFLNYKTSEEVYQIIESLPDIKSTHYQIDKVGVYQYLTVIKN